MEDHHARVRKAQKAVERNAAVARGRVVLAQRAAQAEERRKKNEEASRTAKEYKRNGKTNDAIARLMGCSEATVRALLLMKIRGEV